MIEIPICQGGAQVPLGTGVGVGVGVGFGVGVGVALGVGVGVGEGVGVGVGVGVALTGCHSAGTLGGSQPTWDVWPWMQRNSAPLNNTRFPAEYAVLGCQFGMDCANAVKDARHSRQALKARDIGFIFESPPLSTRRYTLERFD